MLKRAENSHIWEREAHEHYVEPEWCSRRLFEVERFEGGVWDPACGFGRIPLEARYKGLPAHASDIVHRSEICQQQLDFFKFEKAPMIRGYEAQNIVSNPPFEIFREFAEHSLKLATGKVALIWLVRTLNAARWLNDLPLKRILFLTPRPSMPPGHVIAAGQKPGGGKQDFCWLIFDHTYNGEPTIGWLHRDGERA
jgi:hypothetical protein